jgi:hypothetical protein
MSKARQLADLGNVYDDGALSHRNILINGKFEVNQYNDGSSTSFAAGAYFVADRFDYYTNAGAFAVYSATHEISSDAPDGFSKSLKITCTSGGTIPSTGEVVFRQKIEGYNSSVLNYGSANGESATVSFWIKASVTGDYGLQFVYYDGTNSQFYVSKYTVNSANTWEYKTVTIPPQTTNAFDNVTNGNGLTVYWDLGEGSTYSGTAGAGWGTTYLNGLSGGVKLMENTGATWQITGVQLEVGDTATPFEHRSYGDELARCQRYFLMCKPETSAGITHAGFANLNARSTTARYSVVHFPVSMRVRPSVAYSGSLTAYSGSGSYAVSAISMNGSTEHAAEMEITAASGATVGHGGWVRILADAYVEFDSEL